MILYHATVPLPGKAGRLVEAFGATQMEARAHLKAALTRHIAKEGSDKPDQVWVREHLGRATYRLLDTSQVYVDGQAVLKPEEQLATGVFDYWSGCQGVYFDRGFYFEGQDRSGFVEVAAVLHPEDQAGIHISFRDDTSGDIEWAHLPFEQEDLQGFVGGAFRGFRDKVSRALLTKVHRGADDFWTVDVDQDEFVNRYRDRAAFFRGEVGKLVVLFGEESFQVGVFFLEGTQVEEVAYDLLHALEPDDPEFRKVDIVPKRAA